MSTPAPEWLAPWDEPWVKIHKLTKPMFVVLYGAEPGGRVDRPLLYPAGQNRLIMSGLYQRYLIDEDRHLTAAGLVLAVWTRRAMARAYPVRPDEVRAR